MSSHLPSFFKSHKNKQAAAAAAAAAQQAQAQSSQQQRQQQQQPQYPSSAAQSGGAKAVASPGASSTGTASSDRTVQASGGSGGGGSGYGGGIAGANKGVSTGGASAEQGGFSEPRTQSKLSSNDSGSYNVQSATSAKHQVTNQSSASEGGSSVSDNFSALPVQARTLSSILSGGGGGPASGGNSSTKMQQPYQAAYGQGQQQYGQEGSASAGIPVIRVQPGYGMPQQEQEHYPTPHPQDQSSRNMSVEMTDVSNLSINSPQPVHPSDRNSGAEQQRAGSADEERAREKLREAQEQAAQAQAALQYASQQARVANINAVATQAAFENVSGANVVKSGAQPQATRKTAGRYALSDFAIERTLGTGSFGRVHLVRSKHNGRFYAVKVLGKEKVVKMKQVEHTNSEREMLVRVRHPFLVNLWGTFHDVNNLYMVMDFVAGGELFSLLRKSQRFPNSVAKFYAAEVALALDYLHSLDIIYRDLKPENLLLGADGHVKVTDFGFAKYVPDITWTLCGTPDYLAPEVVQSKGYNKSVDWYALGVLIFEMLAGYPPFFTEDGNPMKLYEKIIAGKVRYPAYFDVLAKELLKHLLTGDLTKRYGNLRGGSADIFSHGWFAEVDWDKLYKREIPAPYVPKIEGDGDASQFDRYQEADVSEYGKSGRGPHDHLFPEF